MTVESSSFIGASQVSCVLMSSSVLGSFYVAFFLKIKFSFSNMMYMNAIIFQFSRRTMAGGFPSKLRVKKNKFVEEWNGKREITEKSFKFDQEKYPSVLVTLIFIPLGIYLLVRREMATTGDRRYKNTI